MHKARRYISILLLILLAIISIPNFFNLNNYKSEISEKFFKITNHHLIINGDIKLFLLPKLQLKIKDTKIVKNIDDKESIIQIDNIMGILNIIPLFFKNIVIENIIIEKPIINYNYNDSYKKIFISNKPDIYSKSKSFDYNLKELTIDNAILNYKDVNDKLIMIEDLNLKAKRNNKNYNIDISLKNNDLKSDLKIVLSSLSKLSFTDINSDFYASININKNIYDNILSAEIDGNITNKSNKFILSANTKSSNINIEDLFLHKIYKITNQHFPKIDFYRAQKTDKINIDNKSIDLDLKINLKANNIYYNSLKIDEFDSNIYFVDNKLELNSRNLKISDKNILSNANVEIRNFNKKDPVINLKLDSTKFPVNILFSNNLTNWITGNGKINLNASSIGYSIKSILENLKGNGFIEIDEGHITKTPEELNKISNIIFNNDIKKIIFNKISGKFEINNGVINNNDLKLESELANVKGYGSLDLNSNYLDYYLTPINIINKNNSESLSIKLSGKLNKIKFSLTTNVNLIDKIIEKIDKKTPKMKNLIEKNLNKALELIK